MARSHSYCAISITHRRAPQLPVVLGYRAEPDSLCDLATILNIVVVRQVSLLILVLPYFDSQPVLFVIYFDKILFIEPMADLFDMFK